MEGIIRFLAEAEKELAVANLRLQYSTLHHMAAPESETVRKLREQLIETEIQLGASRLKNIHLQREIIDIRMTHISPKQAEFFKEKIADLTSTIAQYKKLVDEYKEIFDSNIKPKPVCRYEIGKRLLQEQNDNSGREAMKF